MAQRVVTIVSDDLTGKEGEDVQTVTFGLDGKSYEIDLSSDSHDELVEALNPFILKARKTGKARAGSASSGRSSQSGQATAKVREWAKGQGYELADRGRVPANIKEAYAKAH